MAKLIVNQGERVTEHELGEGEVVIGRDPECELFFADKKLSRRHAKVSPSGAGFKIVDLSSRNGSWVNEERVDEHELLDGDEIRLGGLKIYFDAEESRFGPVEEAGEGDESTIYLPRASTDAEGTIALDRVATPTTRDGEGTVSHSRVEAVSEDGATRALTSAEVEALDEADETLKRDEPGPDQTVVLADERRPSADTGTVIFRGEVQPLAPETRLASSEDAGSGGTATTLDRSLREEGSEPSSARPGPRPSGYAVRLVALACGAALFAVLVLAVPLMRTYRGALSEEFRLRGRALAGLLAAANDSALGQGRTADVTVLPVTEEPGVTAAYLLDPMGRVVAPKEGAGQPLELPALDLDPAEVRAPQWGRSAGGDLVVAEPVSYRGRRVGVAIVTLRTPSAGGPALVLLMGFALLLVGLTSAVFLTKRWTLEPVRDLLEDVEAISDARSQQVSTERPFVELSALAENVNRIVGRPSTGA